MSRYDGSSTLSSPPTYDGVPSGGGGGGSVPDDIDIESVCAVTGTFQNLGVGTCGSPLYNLPTAANVQPKGIITNQGGTVTIPAGNPGLFVTTYIIGSPFVRNIAITAGEYEIGALLNILTVVINGQIGLDGGTNVVSITLGGDGKINFDIGAGNITSILLSDVFGWSILGNIDPTSFSPPSIKFFDNLPTYTSTETSTNWNGYNFDDTGTIYSGDMTITGALTVNTIISDLEVEDAIITLNKNGVADTNTSGVVLNNSSNTQFSGLLKNSSSSDFYLFANSATLPTETGWVPVKNGNLFLESVDSTVEYTKNLAFREIGTEIVQADALYDSGAFNMNFQTNNFLQATSGNLLLVNPAVSGNALQIGTSNIDLRFTGDDRFLIDGTETKLWSPDLDFSQSISNAIYLVKKGLVNRLYIDNSFVDLQSGNGNYVLSVGNDRIRMSDIGGARVDITGLQSIVKSPNKTNFVNVDDDGIALRYGAVNAVSVVSNSVTINDAGGSRIDISATESVIKSPDKTTCFITDNNQILMSLSTVPRFQATLTDSRVISQGGNTAFVLADLTMDWYLNGVQVVDMNVPVNRFYGGPAQESQMFLGGNIFGCGFAVGGTTRLLIRTNITTLSSPDTTTKIEITDLFTTVDVAGNEKIKVEVDLTTISNDVECSNDLTCKNTFKIGTAPNEYSFPSLVGGTGQVLAVTAPNTLSFVGSVLYKADLTTEIDNTTPVLVVGTPAILLGASASSLTGFTLTPGQCQVTYTGLENIEISAYIGLSGRAGAIAGSDNARFDLSFYKNGAKQLGKTSSQLDTTDENPKEMSLMRNISLVTGDVLDVRIINQTLLNSLITNCWTLSLHKIGY